MQEGQFCKSKMNAPTCDRLFLLIVSGVSGICMFVVVSSASTAANRLGRLVLPHYDTAFLIQEHFTSSVCVVTGRVGGFVGHINIFFPNRM